MRTRSRRVRLLILLMWLLGSLQGCIGDLYQSIRSDLDFPLEPQSHHQLKSNPEVVAIHYVPEPSLSTEGDASGYDLLPGDDPLLEIKDRFLTALREQVGLTNVQAVPAPRFHHSEMLHGVSMRELLRVFGQGLVLDFQTRGWTLSLYGDEKWWELATWSNSSPPVLAYMVRARLLDLDRKQLLWQANCSAKTERHRVEEWTANQNQLVKDERDELVSRCTQVLIEKFLRGPTIATASPTHK
ncbi:MAG: hypothetical protein AB7G68_12380 [Nitrospiraceae bacterium]